MSIRKWSEWDLICMFLCFFTTIQMVDDQSVIHHILASQRNVRWIKKWRLSEAAGLTFSRASPSSPRIVSLKLVLLCRTKIHISGQNYEWTFLGLKRDGFLEQLALTPLVFILGISWWSDWKQELTLKVWWMSALHAECWSPGRPPPAPVGFTLKVSKQWQI